MERVLRIITKLAMLAVIVGVVSCSGIAGEPIHDLKPEPTPLKLLSAKRISGGWNPVGRKRGVIVAVPEWLTFDSWLASPAVLTRLESVLLNRSWVSMSEYALDGGKSGFMRGSQGRRWIDCTFSNGRELRVFLFGEGEILDGWHNGADGICGYSLDITAAEYTGIMKLSGWDELERGEMRGNPGPENDKSLALMSTHPETVFRPSLAHNSWVEPASIWKATRSTLTAQGETLRLLEKAVQGTRWSILSFTMDGEIHAVERDDDPFEEIVCEMSDGQIITIHVFESDGAWCVIGEGSFRLAISASQSRGLLRPSGWIVAP